jgi:hypothetical protein
MPVQGASGTYMYEERENNKLPYVIMSPRRPNAVKILFIEGHSLGLCRLPPLQKTVIYKFTF